MKLIERYIEEIGKHLPGKTRADLQTEIRSTLEDMIEDRAQAAGQPVDDNIVREVLKDYGAPDQVAASYLPERYLIGPRLFPVFSLVLKIVFSVLTGLAVVGLGIRFGTSVLTVNTFFTILGKTLLEYAGAIISAFGNIVVIFAILQWALPASEFDDENEEKGWDPAILEKEPEPDDVNIWSPVWAIVMTVAALLIFNLYPQVIGIGFLSSDHWVFVPALTEAFFTYLPWIDALWVLQILLNVILLRQRRWTSISHWMEDILTLLSIITAYILLKGPALVYLSAETLNSIFQDTQAAATLAKIFNLIPTIVLVVILVVESIELINKIYRLLIKSRQVIPTIIK